MTQHQGAARPRAVRAVGAALAIAAGVAGLVALGYGMTLRFSIENTEEALAAEARGGWWLLVATALLLAAAAAARWSRAPWWTAALIAVPVLFGVIPALLLPGNIIPYGTALLSALFTITGVAATGVFAIVHRRRRQTSPRDGSV